MVLKNYSLRASLVRYKMNTLKALIVLACVVAASSADGKKQIRQQYSNYLQNEWKPTNWISASELESLPALDQLSLQQFEKMNLLEGAILADKLYHLSQVNKNFETNFAPKASEISAYIVHDTTNIERFPLSKLRERLEHQMKYGNMQEVTIFVTGYPEVTDSIRKANKNLIEAYRMRYNNQNRFLNEDDNTEVQQNENRPTGIFVVIELGEKFNDYTKMLQLDMESTGLVLGKVLMQVTDELNIPQETIHLIGQGVSAHIVGAAARAYTRLTGHQLRRITALDPTRITVHRQNAIQGLARGDAEFVDAIHTSAHGFGTVHNVADVDFYPNGPSFGVPGADNVVEAAMRATRYFAETVRPGNERNFPAVAANSLEQYQQNRATGRRAHMGIATEYDTKGNYILSVNPRSPFGQQTPAKKQANYHNQHKAWRPKLTTLETNNNDNNNY